MRSSKTLAVQHIFRVLLALALISSSTLLAQNQDVVKVGELVVYSLPEAEADVYIDGKCVGKTPFFKKIETGTHELTLKKEMYYDFSKTIKIDDSRCDLKVEMRPKYGFVKIETTPMGANVYFNDQKFEALTPCISEKIMAGKLDVSIQLDEYHRVDTSILVPEGDVYNLRINLNKIPTVMSISKQDYDYQLYGIKPVVAETSSVSAKKKIQHGLWIKGGIGLSHVWGEDVKTWPSENYNFKFPTWYVGVQYTIRFGRVFALGIDLDYSETGYEERYSADTTRKIKFSGIDLPLVTRFYFLKNGVGPVIELGGIVNYKKDYTTTITIGSSENKEVVSDYHAINYGAVAGLGCDFRLGEVVCTVNARAVLELSKIFENVNYNLVYFQFGIGVNIF